MVINGEISAENSDIKSISEMPCINADLERPPLVNVEVIAPKKSRILRNLFLLCISYFLSFTGFWTLSNLQSTMNASQGMGVDSQALIYLCSMVSCFFPELLIEKFGTKSTYVMALLLCTPYIAANFSLRWDTMMVSAILFGLISGPLNACLSIYTDELATRFKSISNESHENIQAAFFGTGMIFSELTQVLGNTVSYLIFNQGRHPQPSNISVDIECGVHFQPGSLNNTNLEPPSLFQRHLVTGIFVSFCLLGVVAAFFMDSLKNDIKEVKGCYTVYQRIISAVKHLRNPLQLLLLPLSIYCGIEGPFYAAEFTEAFIACSWGVHHVGFVTICFGVCGALMALLVGPLVKCISQMSVILLAAVINIVTCVMLFVWQPSPAHPVAYFAFAGVWGMSDAIWWSQIAALYGLMFPNDREAAFSNFFFWSFLGYFLSYSYANYFSVAVKIYIMLAFLIFGIAGYIIGQVKIKCARRSGYIVIGDSE